MSREPISNYWEAGIEKREMGESQKQRQILETHFLVKFERVSNSVNFKTKQCIGEDIAANLFNFKRKFMNGFLQSCSDSHTVTIDTQIIERFSSAWKCGICKKVCSTKKSTITHLIDVHQMSKSKVENMAKYAK